ncbi:MAG: protein-disulfide reductase DsbD domain-containing protein [Rhodoblastus sp.]
MFRASRRRLLALAGFFVFYQTIAATIAHAGAGVDKARVSFVSGGPMAEGVYQAAIVIDLDPNTTTYWRNPGEAGSPPVFDFSASANLEGSTVALPAPKRIVEAGLDVFGYHDRVIFPVTLRPRDAALPLKAALKMDYAACEKICVPMHAEAVLEFSPKGGPAGDPALVAAARAALPKAVAAETAVKITPVAGAKRPTWTVTPKAAGVLDLFAETTEGYFAETKREANGAFRLVLVDAPAPKAPILLTMTTKDGAVEFSARLDGGPAAP